MIDAILVPQGAEYKAVCRGLHQTTGAIPTVLSIPVGMQPLTKCLQQWQKQQQSPSKVLVMGLCGSLRQRYAVGDMVLYQHCTYQGQVQECDRTLTTQLYSRLHKKVSLVKGLTSDRIIWSATEKSYLGETSDSDVVDMESFAALKFFQQIGVAVAVLRVVSDDCQHDIPDLTAAISPDGSLQTVPLAWGLIRQPLAATRLIRGSLQGLKVLETLTQSLFIKR
ncbi:phosphorylase [Fortiea sp. LEGE XX443]|uniref:5'-methylthioadenosine/S-adenosylhomocysteine nucleosidase family protein n=1 Tax=Fortiea sp. LEGE XX443 TaxID=1828611 RepID=UPI00187F1115|nr:phosphorylase [Fortiea sp. LEGE XX443]MBE9005617.1 phosphorylase [Fortiea sp. LEGE XX443]